MSTQWDAVARPITEEASRPSALPLICIWVLPQGSVVSVCVSEWLDSPRQEVQFENEEWRPVVGWEGLYEVSDQGRVKRLERETTTRGGNVKVLPEKIMTSKPGADGYVHIQLKHNGKRVVTKACRIVAEAFIPNPDGHVAVHHLNGVRDDCRVENLAWGSRGGHPRTNGKWEASEPTVTLESVLDAHTMPGEEWRDIAGYEELYLISNFGRVLSVPRPKAKSGILAPATGSNGYQHVTLSKNGDLKIESIHQLVARAFLENPNNDPVINHKDEDKLNNFCDNLEWCTYEYNINYGTAIERACASKDYEAIGKKISKALKGKPSLHPHPSTPVYQFDLDGNLINKWPSAKEASVAVGCCTKSIGNACRRDKLGDSNVACGFRWSYKETTDA